MGHVSAWHLQLARQVCQGGENNAPRESASLQGHRSAFTFAGSSAQKLSLCGCVGVFGATHDRARDRLIGTAPARGTVETLAAAVGSGGRTAYLGLLARGKVGRIPGTDVPAWTLIGAVASGHQLSPAAARVAGQQGQENDHKTCRYEVPHGFRFREWVWGRSG